MEEKFIVKIINVAVMMNQSFSIIHTDCYYHVITGDYCYIKILECGFVIENFSAEI
jgi:hypothetical protein